MLKKVFLIACLIASCSIQAQPDKAAPVVHKVSNKAVVQSVFPDAEKVDKVNNFWYKIVNPSGHILGFAMVSTPYCQTVKGYSGNTPVMIITDTHFIIKKVDLLTNQESLNFVNRLKRNGFFDLWDGKSLKAAKKVQLDGYTGATYTARAVGKNVNFLLANGANKLPKVR